MRDGAADPKETGIVHAVSVCGAEFVALPWNAPEVLNLSRRYRIRPHTFENENLISFLKLSISKH